MRPAPSTQGTRIEVAELFAATPARLKFLKSDRAEAQAVAEVLRRLAVAHPQIRFSLSGDHLHRDDLSAGAGRRARARRGAPSRVLGADFAANAVPVDQARENLRLFGEIGLPTYHRGTSGHIHFVVNGRPVRDRLLLGAVRGAYADVMPSDRHPVLALFIDCDPAIVDVNVHPAKTEVRFRDPALMRSLVVSALRDALARAGFRAATTGGARTLEALRPGDRRAAASRPRRQSRAAGTGLRRAFAGWQAPAETATLERPPASPSRSRRRSRPLRPRRTCARLLGQAEPRRRARSAPRGRRSTAPTSSRRRRTASSSSTSTPPTSASSTSA